MQNKFNSLMAILNMLDRKDRVTLRSLMEELGVKERSVYRYLRTLQEAGFPILFDRERESYSFAEGYGLGRPDLSLEERLAIALARTMMTSYGTGIDRSLAAIENKLADCRAKGAPAVVLQGPPAGPEVTPALQELHGAIANYRLVAMTYHAHHAGEVTEREVEPCYLFFHDGFWYLRGFCRTAEEMRTFALDGIEKLAVLPRHFVPQQVDPEEELSSAFGTWLDGELVEVVVRFGGEVKRQVLRKRWHRSQQSRDLPDGGVELSFRVKGSGGIKRWLYQWIPHVTVMEPATLRDEMRQELIKAAA